jgi:hypothetical protein
VRNCKILRLLLCAFALAPVFAGPALATGAFEWDTPLSGPQKLLLEAYFKQPASAFSIAPADLNEDGIPEFVVRSGCEASLCTYKILAEQNSTLIELGNLQAFNIQSGNASSNGVRNILAYKNADNDFRPALYVWEPQAARYIMKEQK